MIPNKDRLGVFLTPKRTWWLRESIIDAKTIANFASASSLVGDHSEEEKKRIGTDVELIRQVSV